MASIDRRGLSAELSLAAPTVTSFTATPASGGKRLAHAATQEPQCIPSIFNVNSAISPRFRLYLMIAGNERFECGLRRGASDRCAVTGKPEAWKRRWNASIRRAPLVGVGAVVVDDGRVLLVRRGSEPLKGHWTLPGGVLEVGESLAEGVVREVREETGLEVEPIELIEVLDRIHREGERVRYHYVIADYLCRVMGGELQAASDADAVRWVERAEWNSHSALIVDPVTVRVIERGWQRAQVLRSERR